MSKDPLIVPVEFLEEHEKQIEIAPAEAERDRQQNRGGRREGEPGSADVSCQAACSTVVSTLKRRKLPGSRSCFPQ